MRRLYQLTESGGRSGIRFGRRFSHLSRPQRVLWAIVPLAVLVSACGSESGAAPESRTVVSEAARPVSIEEIQENLPMDFRVGVYQREEILGGTQPLFSEIVALGMPVVLNTWAGLCPPCRVEMPDLQAVFEELGDSFILLGLDVGPFTGLGSFEDGRALIEELGVTYPAGNTDESRVVPAYRILGMPSTFFIKPNGEVFESWIGLINESKLRELVLELVAAS